jgi:methyl-accepting chemotaxis protein
VLISEADSSSQRSMQVIEQVNIEVEETAQSLQEILSNTKELFIGGEQILEAMTSLTQVSLQVKENSGEIRKESDIMSSSVSTVADISGEVVAGMNEIAVGTHEITENMASINRQMQVLSEITDSLKGEVGRFKV